MSAWLSCHVAGIGVWSVGEWKRRVQGASSGYEKGVVVEEADSSRVGSVEYPQVGRARRGGFSQALHSSRRR